MKNRENTATLTRFENVMALTLHAKRTKTNGNNFVQNANVKISYKFKMAATNS